VKDFEDTELLTTVKRFLQHDTLPPDHLAERRRHEITTIDVLSHANNLLDRHLYHSTLTNKINQLASAMQDFDQTLLSVFELLSRIIIYHIGVIAVLGTQGIRLRLYFYIVEQVSPVAFDQAKTQALQAFAGISSLSNIETYILHGSIHEASEAPLLSLCESSLVGRNKLIGTIVLGDMRKGKFSDETRETLQIASSEMAVVIDNARLYDANARMHQDLERELRRAHDIQAAMLPHDNPMETALSIEATSIPAKEVGGDYYDYFQLTEHQLLLAIGDVTGKGAPAALMMATVKAALQVRTESTTDVRDIMVSLNKLVCHQASKQYMTLFLGVIDVRERTFTYCNAGHNFPYVISNDATLRYLERSSLPLGFVDTETYISHVYPLKEHDVLFFYTDGVIEAMNANREIFGYPRLEDILRPHCCDKLLDIQLKILERIEVFCQETPQDDDMTMVFVQCVPTVTRHQNRADA
jgi:serine phosphatase RsbU (regulator of sigma subunit)